MPSSSPTPRFDATQLHSYIKSLLSSQLTRARYSSDADAVRALVNDLSQRVKERMREIQPHGFKHVVAVQLTENLGQQGRAGMSSHWDAAADACVTEVFSNDSLVCVVTAFAIRAF